MCPSGMLKKAPGWVPKALELLADELIPAQIQVVPYHAKEYQILEDEELGSGHSIN